MRRRENTMTLTFQHTGQLAAAAGAAGEMIEIAEGAVLGAVLKELADRHGSGYRDLVFDASGRVRTTLLVALDGIQASGCKETLPLDGVSEVMLMTPIAGG
jgi:hypothetical protein